MIPKWDRRFLDLADHIATWSKDPSTKVGAVIIDPMRRIVSTGYNGFHQYTPDDPKLYEDREFKYEHIIHGEENAILFANRDSLNAATLYTVPFMPCSRCAAKVVQVGIMRVVSYKNDNPRWLESFKRTEAIFAQAGIELALYGRSDIADPSTTG